MKYFYIYLVSALLIAVSTPVTAQRIAIAGGFNLSNMDFPTSEGDGINVKVRNTPGIHLGVAFHFPVKEMFSIQSGVFITTKGYRIKEEFNIYGSSYEYKGSFTTYNIEFPVTARVTGKLSKLDVYALFGPAIGVGIVGISNFEEDDLFESGSNTETVHFGSDDDELKRLDIGLKCGAGIRYKKLLTELSYTYGLSDISNYETMRNRVFSVTVGYWFGSFE